MQTLSWPEAWGWGFFLPDPFPPEAGKALLRPAEAVLRTDAGMVALRLFCFPL